jgi:hypothetical protein
MQYFYVTYASREGGHAYREGGVLTAVTIKGAERKAVKAKALYARSGPGSDCAYDSLREIPIVDYLVLKKYVFNIDRYFDEDGELRE